MTAVLLGIVFILVGLWGMSRWFSDVLAAIRGVGPLALFLGGLVSLIVGLSAFRTTKREDTK